MSTLSCAFLCEIKFSGISERGNSCGIYEILFTIIWFFFPPFSDWQHCFQIFDFIIKGPQPQKRCLRTILNRHVSLRAGIAPFFRGKPDFSLLRGRRRSEEKPPGLKKKAARHYVATYMPRASLISIWRKFVIAELLCSNSDNSFCNQTDVDLGWLATMPWVEAMRLRRPLFDEMKRRENSNSLFQKPNWHNFLI